MLSWLPLLGDKHVALIEGQTFFFNRFPLLGDKQVALIGGQTGCLQGSYHMYILLDYETEQSSMLIQPLLPYIHIYIYTSMQNVAHIFEDISLLHVVTCHIMPYLHETTETV